MKASALVLTALLLAPIAQARQAAPAASPVSPPVAEEAQGEPLPADAPQQPYELAAWCYGAMDQYLYIYDQIIPELRDIDHRFGSSVKDEKEPYAADMAAARDELSVLRNAVVAAEKASLKVIAPQGVQAVNHGRDIWGPAQMHTRRELARAWLSWALPDRCDSNARELTAKSNLLGEALKYNGASATDAPAKAVELPAEDSAPAKPADPAETPKADAPVPAPDAPTATAPKG